MKVGVLACLFAYEDKLSGRCEYALYDAAVQLERAVNGLTYAAGECRADLQTYCSNIEPGKGRVCSRAPRQKQFEDQQPLQGMPWRIRG